MMAGLLNAASHGTSKSEILKQANISWNVFKKYLKMALQSGLLCLSYSNFELTKKGELFLQKHADFSKRYLDTIAQLNKLSEEEDALREVFSKRKRKQIQNNQSLQQTDFNLALPTSDHSTFERIDNNEFKKELASLAFSPANISDIISLVEIIHKNNPTFFSGKKIAVIKSCLAYAYVRYTYSSGRPPHNLSRRNIAKFFGVYPATIQHQTKKYLELINGSLPKPQT
jgi:predicted transcriptional regulator